MCIGYKTFQLTEVFSLILEKVFEYEIIYFSVTDSERVVNPHGVRRKRPFDKPLKKASDNEDKRVHDAKCDDHDVDTASQ